MNIHDYLNRKFTDWIKFSESLSPKINLLLGGNMIALAAFLSAFGKTPDTKWTSPFNFVCGGILIGIAVEKMNRQNRDKRDRPEG